MTQYDNNNSGALFKNMKKTSEKDADYSGESEINNQKYMVWARIRTSKTGGAAQGKTAPTPVELNDDIPF